MSDEYHAERIARLRDAIQAAAQALQIPDDQGPDDFDDVGPTEPHHSGTEAQP